VVDVGKNSQGEGSDQSTPAEGLKGDALGDEAKPVRISVLTQPSSIDPVAALMYNLTKSNASKRKEE
jgi:hypothetical protein